MRNFILLISTLVLCYRADAQTSTLVWEDQGLTDEAAVSSGSSFNVGEVHTTLTWSIDSDGGTFASYGGADFVSFEEGMQGNHNGHISMGFDNSSNDPDDVIEVTFSFSPTITGLQFTLLDIDAGAWDDGIEVIYNSSLNVRDNPSLYTRGSKVYTDNESYMKGFESAPSSVAQSSTNGNLDLDFGAIGILSVTIRYFSTDDANHNPTAQIVGISDLSFDTPAVLAPQFVTWQGEQQGGAIVLDWDYSDASGLDKFIVERASGGHPFVPIGDINAEEIRSKPAHFTFADSGVAVGENRYRLRLLYLQGDDAYSSVISVWAKPVTMKVYPNPAPRQLIIETLCEKPVTLRILDLHGQEVLRHENYQNGAPLLVDQLNAGRYFLEARAENKRLSMASFVKVDGS